MTIKLIHVGLGGWGKNWMMNVVFPYKAVETTAWVEIDEPALVAAREHFQLPAELCFTSLETALATVEADAVLITASLPGHVPSAMAALKAGKHVLLEKPFAPSLAEANSLVALARQAGKLLMISQNYRFEPAVQAVVALVREQQLPGHVGSIALDFRRYDNTEPVASHRHYHIWEPLLADMSIHHFDLMRYVLGQEPVEVFCKTWNAPWSNYDEPAEGALTVIFDRGTVVNYRGSWVSTAPRTNWAGEWNMVGEHGVISWTSRGELPDEVSLHLMGQEAQQVELPVLPYRDRSGALAAFVHHIENGTEPETTGADNVKTLALMLAAIESARTGVPVKIS